MIFKSALHIVFASALALTACAPSEAQAPQSDTNNLQKADKPKNNQPVSRPPSELKNAVKIDNSSSTKIVMLGTGTPVPTPERSGPSTAIIVGKQSYIFDFGPGVVRRASAMSPRFGGPFEALKGKNLKTVFLTHLHSDHSAGFADLLLTGWSGGHRNEPVKLIGPEGIEKLAKGTHDAFDTDMKYRIYGLEDTNNQGWRVETTIVKEGLVYQDENIKVQAFPVIHGSWPNAFGYRVETADKVIVISGDLAPNDKIREYSKNADYLIHETYCERGLVENMKPIRVPYHRGNHTSTKELAALANEVKPKTLILTHILPFGCTFDEIMDEVKADYSGEVIIANDLDVFR